MGLTNLSELLALPATERLGLAMGLWHGDFQESCHSLAAIQAAWIKDSARAALGSSVGLFIHTSAG